MRNFKKVFTPAVFMICTCYILWCAIEIGILVSGFSLSMKSEGYLYSIIESRKWIYLLQNTIGIILYIIFTFDIWKIYLAKKNSIKDLCYRVLLNIALLSVIYFMVLATIYFILPAFGQPSIRGYLNYTEPAIIMMQIGILSVGIAFFIKNVKRI